MKKFLNRLLDGFLGITFLTILVVIIICFTALGVLFFKYPVIPASLAIFFVACYGVGYLIERLKW